MNNREIAELLVAKLGGKNNLKAIENCMTRIRVVVKDSKNCDTVALEKVEGVLGISIDEDSVQIIVGPGKSKRLSDEMSELTGVKSLEVDEAEIRKAEAKKKNATPGKQFLKHIANVFVPIIPAFIGCGLMLAIYEFCHIFALDFYNSVYGAILGIVAASVFNVLQIVAGYNAAREFGGSPILGACFAAILGSSALNGLELFGVTFVAGRGGVVSVLACAILGALLEKKIRKVMPDVIDTFATPLLTLFIMTFAGLLVLQPVCGFVSDAVGALVTYIITEVPILAGLATAVYLPLVMTGMHHGLIAVNAALIEMYGVTYLLPVTVMAGAAQVGSSLYVLLTTKNKKLKKTVKNSLPIGILGIGEPLIWGVSVPLGKPMIAACLGGLVGGSAMAMMKVAALVPELSGIQFALITDSPIKYVIGYAIAVAAGFLFAKLLGYEDPEE